MVPPAPSQKAMQNSAKGSQYSTAGMLQHAAGLPPVSFSGAQSGTVIARFGVLPPIPNLQALRLLVAQGEGLQLEFKRKAKFPDKIVKELVAFANTAGGWLLIGVDDDGTIVGSPHPHEEEFVMVQAIARHIVPVLSYKVHHIRTTGEQAVVAIEVEAQHATGPYSVVEQEGDRHRITYLRHRDESLQASRELRELMKHRRAPRETRVQIGDKERLLLQYLDQHPHITLPQFEELAHISTRVASRTLVLLTLNGVLHVLPGDGADRYRQVLPDEK